MTETTRTEIIDATPRQLPAVRQPEPAPLTLFGTNDPSDIIERATKVAVSLKKVVEQQGLITDMGGGRKHPNVEAWTLLGSMLGVFPVGVWTRPLVREGKVYGYEARVEAHTRDGAIVGAAESMCTRDEPRWNKRKEGDREVEVPEYALRGMAQTRAVSRALRAPLDFVMKLAGYQTTGAEEIVGFPGASEAQVGKNYGGCTEPTCSGSRVKRIAGKGPHKGSPFLACNTCRWVDYDYFRRGGGESAAPPTNDVAPGEVTVDELHHRVLKRLKELGGISQPRAEEVLDAYGWEREVTSGRWILSLDNPETLQDIHAALDEAIHTADDDIGF